MDIEGKKVTVMGLGQRTALPLLKFLKKKNCQILVSEKNSKSPILAKVKELDKTITIEAGEHTQKVYQGQDLIVLCPGVPFDLPVLIEAKKHAVPIWSELELAFRYSKASFIAITGTNGKSTVTTILASFLESLPGKTILAGNIGIPLIGIVESLTREDRIVAELSSFQLEVIEKFKPQLACILNIDEDHLDRHHSLQNYVDCKKAIYSMQDKEDTLFLNLDNPTTAKIAKEDLTVKKQTFSLFNSEADYFQKGNYFYKKNKEEALLAVEDIKITGRHNRENILAALAMADYLGVTREDYRDKVRKFKGLPHVLELVGTRAGLNYINDSKGTNPAATISALQEIEGRIILLAGGQERGADYSLLAKEIAKRVDLLILFGENKEKVKKAVRKEGYNNIIMVNDLKNAVKTAKDRAREGTTILLSPASPSWDQFSSYSERGDIFKDLVNKL